MRTFRTEIPINGLAVLLAVFAIAVVAGCDVQPTTPTDAGDNGQGSGTDGTDGPTDAAGGLVDGGTVERGERFGMDARRFLADNDSYTYLAATGDLVVTGPTRTNVNDLMMVFSLAGLE